MFKKKRSIRGRTYLLIEQWPRDPFKNTILNRIWELFLGFVVWELWLERNQRIFERRWRQEGDIWAKIYTHVQEMLGLTWWKDEDMKAGIEEAIILKEWDILTIPIYKGINQIIQLTPRSPDKWEPPPQGTLKLNFDGASKGNPGEAGFGSVVRNSDGHIMGLQWGYVDINTNNVA